MQQKINLKQQNHTTFTTSQPPQFHQENQSIANSNRVQQLQIEAEQSKNNPDFIKQKQQSDEENAYQFQKQLDYKINLGAYKQIAQKLDKHLQDIYEADQNQKNRWIWQLLQNAKDTPNIFSKTRIKIVITEKCMKFMHNADSFTLDNLIALVQQFSSKSDKNSSQVQTTGKYGTGFITTHMISRIINVKGKFQYKLNDGITRSRDFQIKLDRSYVDRDKDLVQKVANNMYQLRNLGQKSSRKSLKRKQDQFNTVFIYDNLDQTGLKYIDYGIQDLIRTFNYTFLFNPKISSIQIQDHRKSKRIILMRGEQTKNSSLQTFESIHIQKDLNIVDKESEIVRKSYLLYIQNKEYQSKIAMPFEIVKGNKIKLIRINENIPRLFKEFPLIGTQKWGYNYVLNCKYFYPNQKRSGLRLKLIEQRPDLKVISNRKLLINLMDQVENFYNRLSKYADFNLSYLAISNYDQNCETQNFIKKEIFVRFRQFIKKLKIIRLIDNSLECLQKIEIPFVYKDKEFIAKKISIQLYNTFFFILNKKNIIFQQYDILFPSLYNHHKQWNELKFLNIYSQIKYIHQQGSQKIKKICQRQGLNFIQQLKIIYTFLQKRGDQYLNESSIFKIALTQSGKFQYLKYLRIKDNLPKVFIQILDKLNYNIEQQLINDQIKHFFKLNRQFNEAYCQQTFHRLFFTSDPEQNITDRHFVILFNLITTYNTTIQNCKNMYTKQFRKKIYKFGINIKLLSKQSQSKINEQFYVNYKPLILKFFNQVSNLIRNNKSNSLSDLTRIFKSYQNNDQQQMQIIQWLNQYKQITDSLQFSDTNYNKNNYNFNYVLNYKKNFIQPKQTIYIPFKITSNQLNIYDYAESQRIIQQNQKIDEYNRISYNKKKYQPLQKLTFKKLEQKLLHSKVKKDLWQSVKTVKYGNLFQAAVKLYNNKKSDVILNRYKITSVQISFIKNVLNLLNDIIQQDKNLSNINNISQMSNQNLDNVIKIEIVKIKKQTFKTAFEKRLQVLLSVLQSSQQQKNVICSIISNLNQLNALNQLIKMYGSCRKILQHHANMAKQIK